LTGAFTFGNIAPNFQAFSTGIAATGKILATVSRVHVSNNQITRSLPKCQSIGPEDDTIHDGHHGRKSIAPNFQAFSTGIAATGKILATVSRESPLDPSSTAPVKVARRMVISAPSSTSPTTR
jgi:ribulose kinase